MKKTSGFIGSVALCAIIAGPLSARANLLTNGALTLSPQYQSGGSQTPSFLTASPSSNASALLDANGNGWSIISGNVDVIPTTYWQSSAGSYSVDMIGSGGTGKSTLGVIAQYITGLTPNQQYQLTFDLSANPSSFDGEQVDTRLLDVSVSNSNQGAPTEYTTTVGTRTPTNMQYVTETLDFTALWTSSTITFAAGLPTNLPAHLTDGTVPSSTNLYCGPVIDNIDLEPLGGTPQTPEPASLGILGIGGMMLLRRKSARKA